MTDQDTAGSVVSRDGTRICFDRYGSGAPVVLVGGAFTDRLGLTPLAEALAPRFTVYAYDRRGRGDSGDTAPYAVNREVEDLAAVIGEAGQAACLFGHSSGATLALLAAANGLPVRRLGLYEPPFIVDGSRTRPPPDLASRLTALAVAGREGEALEYWLAHTAGVPADGFAELRDSPSWAALAAMVHTAAYDATIMADYMTGGPLPPEWADLVTVPALVMAGDESGDWARNSVRALTGLLPSARLRTFPAAGHGLPLDALVPVLHEFFAAA
ncbi:MAG: alpha/beta hydrolase [Nocardiopsaceae bacterium]|nr:alpha/beta hydrolase [Nocardiopsaceae bacterium]